jgi:hypothetical protein
LAARPLAAQWRIEAWLGDAWSARSTLTVGQANQPDLAVHAKWSTKPFAPTWVYSGRIAKWSGDAAWAFELMHHKIYLDNPTAEVQFFRVHNGMNFLLAERLWHKSGWEFGVGVGPVLAVPVSSVRGRIYDQSSGLLRSHYEFAGPGLQLNLARRLKLLPHAYGSLSLKLTATELHLSIVEGTAVTPNFAVHLQYGVSLQGK